MRKRTLPSQPGIDEEICDQVPPLRVIHVVSAILPQPGYTPNKRGPGITSWGTREGGCDRCESLGRIYRHLTPASSGSESDGSPMLATPTPSEPSQATAINALTASHALESNPWSVSKGRHPGTSCVRGPLFAATQSSAWPG